MTEGGDTARNVPDKSVASIDCTHGDVLPSEYDMLLNSALSYQSGEVRLGCCILTDSH